MKNELEKYKKWSDPAVANNAQLEAAAKEAESRVAPALNKYKVKQESINERYASLTGEGAKEEYVKPAEDRYQAKLEDIAQRDAAIAAREKERYNAAVGQQAAVRSAAKRDAYIAHERLQKYLPQARAVQGIEGMGMTETAQVQGLNAYLANRSAADAAYAAAVRDLDLSLSETESERELTRAQEEAAAKETYLTESDALLREYLQKLDDKVKEEEAAETAYVTERDALLENYRKEQEALLRESREKEEREAATRSEAVTDALAAQAEQMFLSSADGKISQEDYNTLEAYVNANQEKLSPLDAELIRDITLEGYRKQIRSEAEQAAMDKGGLITVNASYSDIKDFEDNKNLVVTANGTEYRVQLNAPDDSSVRDADVKAAAKKVGNGEVFGYGERLYIKHDGDVYAIEERDNSAKGEYSALYDLFYA